MDLIVEIRPLDGYLSATVRGAYRLDAFKDIWRRVVEATQEHGLPAILLDCLAMSGQPTLAENRDFAAFAFKLRWTAMATGKSSGYRTAIAASAEAQRAQRPAQDDLTRRNLDIRTFDSRADAEAWLLAVPETH
jgi:hypothetical protein